VRTVVNWQPRVVKRSPLRSLLLLAGGVVLVAAVGGVVYAAVKSNAKPSPQS
jgi:hypothetical protein